MGRIVEKALQKQPHPGLTMSQACTLISASDPVQFPLGKGKELLWRKSASDCLKRKRWFKEDGRGRFVIDEGLPDASTG